MRRGHERETFTDPVCGMKLSRDAAVEECEYRGRVYFLGSPLCRERFESEPDQYVRARVSREGHSE